MKAPTETKKIEQTSGLQEPWRTLSQVVYYGVYVGFFGKMCVFLAERAINGS